MTGVARLRWPLAALYLASGAVGLLDEVIFFKYLSLTFGATAHASSAVLVAFMAGLALGAALIARWDARIRRPLLLYGGLEIAVGVACALAPWLFAGVARLYVGVAAGASSLVVLEVIRGGLAGAVVLLPTLAMGATLPLVARVAASRVALLYGANTAGGAIGSLLGAYVIIPTLGLSMSLRAGACVSVAIGVAAIALSRAGEVPADATPADANRVTVKPLPTSLFVAAAASGLFVFAGEVVFVHLLALVDGTSVYVFGLVLAVFLVALAAGASVSRLLERKARDGALPVSLAMSGLALAATLPVWDRLPEVFVGFGPSVATWTGREAVRGVVAAMAIGVPATCMGTTFPLVLSSLAPRPDRGAQTGRVTAVNTVASVAGSVLGGYVLLPALGSQRACAGIAFAYVAAALVVAGVRSRTVLVLSATTVGALVLAPRWDLARLASGANVYFAPQPEQGRVAWVHEDVHGGVVTVTEAAGRHTLWTNGKYQGDDGPQMQAQRGFADVPAMFVPRFDRALVVGLGTGTTLAALSDYPFARIDVAELSPGIAEAARSFFATVNRGVLGDTRVRLVQEDGRNLLLVGRDRYDLVTIELTSIWFAGAANLYNREFYATAAGRLSEGGVLSQWIQLHHTTLVDIASQMATARAVFPHGAFFVRGEQGMLVSSLAPLVAHPRAASDLDDLILADDTIDAFVEDVCVQAHVPRAALISTDDNERLEYATPRNNVPGAASIAEMRAQLQHWKGDELAARVGVRSP
ncbi:MAG TPA: spermidine synthase [Polyangiaceae bacterium]